MTRPPASALVALGIGALAGRQATRHRHLIAALIWGRRLPADDPTGSDTEAVVAYLSTHRSHP